METARLPPSWPPISLPAWPPRVGSPASRALAAAGIDSAEALAAWRRGDLLALHGLGPKALRLLEADLRARGLAFREG